MCEVQLQGVIEAKREEKKEEIKFVIMRLKLNKRVQQAKDNP